MVMRFDHADDDFEESHEINVTPFIDVMLVLLIIFIIAAPLSTVDVPLDLPVSSAQASPPPQDPVMLSVQKDLSLSLGDQPVSEATLGTALAAQTHGNRTTVIFLRADKSLTYEHLMRIMDLLRNAGYLKVALVGLEGNG